MAIMLFRYLYVCALLHGLIAAAFAQQDDFVGGEVMVKFMERATAADRKSVEEQYGLVLVTYHASIDIYHYRSSAQDTWALIANIRSSPFVYFAEPNYIVRLQSLVDFTSDGKADLLWQHSGSGIVHVWAMNGLERVSGANAGVVADTAWRIAGTGDFTGDGKPDILWRHSVNGSVHLWRMDGAVRIAGIDLPPVPDLGWQIGGVGDLTGDGKPDILWRHSGSGSVHLWRMDGTVPIAGVDLPRVADAGWVIAGVGDLTGDGKPDILWRHSTDGRLHLWRMEGTSRAEGLDLPTVADLGWRVGSVADYDGDGKSDLVWRHRGDGKTLIWRMDGTRPVGFVELPTVADTAWRLAGEPQHRLERDLVAHYPLDGSLLDISGQGNHLVSNGAGFTRDQRGRPDAALATTRQTGAASLRNIGISGRSPRTLSVWVKINQTPVWNDGTILQWGTGTNGYFGLQYHAATDAGAYFRGSNLVWDAGFAGAAVRSVPADLTSRWSHLVLVYDGVTARFYLNGRLQDEGATARNLAVIATADSPLRVGNNGNRGVLAAMDNIRVYRRALSSAEVAELYALENGGRASAFAAGVYAGDFTGPGDDGKFYCFVNKDGKAVAVGANILGQEGVATSLTVPPSGVFSGVTEEGASYSGVWTYNKVDGTYIDTDGGQGQFRAVRMPDSGDYCALAGVYRGQFDADGSKGALTVVVAADGTFWFHTGPAVNLGAGGGFGALGPGNKFEGKVLTSSLAYNISGEVDPLTKRFAGRVSGAATGTFSAVRTDAPDWPVSKNDVGRSDFTGNGWADILWQHRGNGQVHVWEMEATKPVTGMDVSRVGDLDWRIGGTGDMTGDGKVDIVWRNTKSGAVHVWAMNRTSFIAGIDVATVADQSWQIGGTGDFTGDGNVDILWRNTKTGGVHVWSMEGTKQKAGINLPTVADQSWQIAATGDMNGDGWVDIVWRNTATGAVHVWSMEGTKQKAGINLPTVADQNWQIGGTADYTGDGWLDILWRNTATGAVHVWRMEGTTAKAGLNLPPVTDANWRIFNR